MIRFLKKTLTSILIPCRNEERFIYKVLENIAEQDYGSENIEVIISDGLSTDQTKSEVMRFCSTHKLLRVKLIDNWRQAVPFALNEALKLSSGGVILRMDAHAVYPKNYVSRLLTELEARPDAWNVGGCWDTQAGDDTGIAKAIVKATSHPIGIGNAEYRFAGLEIIKVDTVPFGCFRKNVFDKIGLFDEDLVRNQDDEFNARIIENGGSIYLIPDLKIKYFARPNLKKLAKMFFQYGYFKPLVNKKIKSPATLRQFAPPFLVIVILLGWIPSLFWSPFVLIYATGLQLYILILLVGAFTIRTSFRIRYLTFFTFLCIHFSYGWGYLKGVFDFMLLNKERKGKTVKISR